MNDLSPRQQLGGMLTGTWVAQAVYVAAKLGLADLLADGPRTPAELAEATQTDAPKMIDAKRDRFIVHQVIPAPLARTPAIAIALKALAIAIRSSMSPCPGFFCA